MFEIVTGEGQVYGPFVLKQLADEIAKIPAWICYAVRVVGCE